MPIFEYFCLKCKKVSEHLVFNEKTFQPYCKFCGDKNVKKLISRVRVKASLESRLEKMADPSLFSGLDENDPKSVMKFMDKMGAEFGSELGDEFDEVMSEAKEEVEKEMESQSREDSKAEGSD